MNWALEAVGVGTSELANSLWETAADGFLCKLPAFLWLLRADLPPFRPEAS